MKRSRQLVLLCGLAALLPALDASWASAQQFPAPRAMGLPEAGFSAPDPEPLRLLLDNGLVAYVVRDHLVPLVRYTALIGAGNADGPGGADYAAALRAGPAALTPKDFEAALRRMAALFEVEQGHVETRVSLEVPTEDAGSALTLFAALLREPRLSHRGEEPTIEVDAATGESGPALYEGSLDTAVEKLEQAIYEEHPYSGRFADGVAANTEDFAARFVRPSNVVLAVSGDIADEAIRKSLATAFESWGRGVASEATAGPGSLPSSLPSTLPLALPAARPPDSRRVLLYPAAKLQGWVAIGHELAAVPLEDEAALMVMNYVLGGGHFDTRLFRATRDRRGLTNDDSGFPEPGFRGPGLYSFRTYGRPEAVRLLIHLTLKEIERIRTEPVTEEELFVARGALADGDFSLWFRNGAATATTYAREWLRYREHGRIASWPKRVRAVTAAEVQNAARRYLHPDRFQIVVVGPLDAIRAAAQMEDEPTLEGFGTVSAGL